MSRPEREETGPMKSQFQEFLESTGGAALMTVILGGIFGTLITAMIQYAEKEREFRQTWLKTRGDQALLVHKDFLEKQQGLIKTVYERLGKSISSSEDLTNLTRTELVLSNELSSEEMASVSKQRKNIIENYNVNDKEWRNERDVLGILISYYFPEKPGKTKVIEVWNNVKDSITVYKHCAEKWFANPLPRDPSEACKDERKLALENIQTLNSVLEENRIYGWEGWNDLESLKTALEKNSK